MDVYFSTVVRSAPSDRGGELVWLDWETKRVKASVPIAATNPVLVDPNPRGNSRGGRGIAVIDDEVWVASYHSLRVFDRELTPRRDLSHPLMVGLHEIFPTDRGSVWVTSTAIDTALEIDVASDEARRDIWPRESRGLPGPLDPGRAQPRVQRGRTGMRERYTGPPRADLRCGKQKTEP